MAGSSYSFPERVLHNIALSNEHVVQTCFDIERLHPRAMPSIEARHVYITGLARCGTTAVLRALWQTQEFRSLTFEDMPFVAMPTWWNAVVRKRRLRGQSEERSHGDGIMIDASSPEAFEEVFWKAYHGRDYIKGDRLVPHQISDDDVARYRSYVGCVLRSGRGGQRRYLSKNNNNVLRLDGIRRSFPLADVVVLFRDPFQHAMSLLNQHRRFSGRHSRDRFELRYMEWLGHYEFGLCHKRLSFFESGVSREFEIVDREEINYWLSIWCDTYRYLLALRRLGLRFVSFESLPRLGDRLVSALSEVAPRFGESFFFKTPPAKPVEAVDEALAGVAQELFCELLDEHAQSVDWM